MQFKDIIGQTAVKQRLIQSVAEGRVPHAQLLAGPSGVGKLQLAIAYAQYLNCPNRTEQDSCGVCPTCLQYQHLQHPDLHFVFPIVKDKDKKCDVCDDVVDKFRNLVLSEGYFDLDDWYKALEVETKQGMIYEKESSEILRKLSLKAFGSGYKVMIIWQPEKMNETCANKLLKLLEEPPAQTVFLLVSEHPEQLLVTILSRTQQICVPRLPESEIAQALQERLMVSPDAAADYAHIANGSYLVAKRLTEAKEETTKEFDAFVALMRNAYTVGEIKDSQKKFEALQYLRKWSLDMADAKVGRERQKRFLQYAQRQVRENYIYNLQHPEINYQTSAERAFSTRFAPFINNANVEAIMNELAKAERQIEQNGNAKMIFFDLCLQMIVLVKNRG